MIKVELKQAYWRPFVYCDVCGKPILDVKRGMVFWESDVNDGDLVPVIHCHKGACDNKATTGKYKAWEELEYHLACLVHNLKPESIHVDAAMWRHG